MNPSEIERIKSQLAGPEMQAGATLVLSLAPGDAEAGLVADPSDFPSRADYRNAMIEKREKVTRGAIDDLVQRLESLGLKCSPAYMSNSVVVEGAPSALAASLDLPEVEDAVVDFQLPSINSR